METTAEKAHKGKVASLERVMAQATPDEVIAGMAWYDSAYDAVARIAQECDLSTSVVAAVFGALSPRNKWARNLLDAENMCRAWANGLDPESVIVSTFHRQRAIAARILRENSPGLLSGPKVTAFALMVGDPSADVVVVDSHAYNAAKGKTLIMGGKGPRVTERRFERCADAYTEVAINHGIKAQQAQAIIWLAWKRIHNL